MIRLAPPGVSVHFHRMTAGGVTGSHEGQEERNRSHIAHLDENVELMSLVKPAVIVMAHTATSYTMGKQGEAEIVERLSRASGIPFITAFGSVLLALRHLGAGRIALGTPYSAEATLKSKSFLEANGFEVVSWGNLANVRNIYEETPERAQQLARQVDSPDAQAVFMSGLGMPTIDVLGKLENELGKPVISSATASMWNALRVAGSTAKLEGFGRLLAQ